VDRASTKLTRGGDLINMQQRPEFTVADCRGGIEGIRVALLQLECDGGRGKDCLIFATLLRILQYR
jgi:hypothetical protein